MASCALGGNGQGSVGRVNRCVYRKPDPRDTEMDPGTSRMGDRSAKERQTDKCALGYNGGGPRAGYTGLLRRRGTADRPTSEPASRAADRSERVKTIFEVVWRNINVSKRPETHVKFS